jgi:hypothetical protein
VTSSSAGPHLDSDPDLDPDPDLDERDLDERDLDPDLDGDDRDLDPGATTGPPVPAPRSAPELDERSLRILAFERRWWRHAGAKEQAIRDSFGVSSTRYYQLLNALLDHPAALAQDPVLVGRLRRLRARRIRPRRG